ncbi:FCD domain-containing protein [Halomonas sp. 18H]|uniref:FCD domain-containing protein n=1 Tax=Halomonas almeriensis TaxID=308163 RepID=UPI00223200D2|nr:MULTISPECIES: FCD domain-containing protein [Halomonas]MCW4152937.1 FCD domain-containing protein [Halomonas sp. 18H]MDN3553135.1 FCD domain-containing protein [Halomonas almeriensis]
MVDQRVRQPRLADAIVERLESMILEGSLKPGQRLPPERQLAEQFGVSRPSLRGAIQTLAARGLLVSRQGGGNFVTEDLNTRHTDPLLGMLSRHSEFHLDLLEFRDALEGLAAYYAAMRATPADRQMLIQRHDELEAAFQGKDPQYEASLDAAFHLAIAEAAHNVLLLHTIRDVFHLLEKSIVENLRLLFARSDARPRLVQQHRALLQAILDGDPEEARQRAHEHMLFVEEGMLELERSETRSQRSLRRAQSTT